jgi:hypothetical protein
MYVGGQAHQLTTKSVIHLKSKIHNVLDIKLIIFKLWVFTNFNTVSPVLVLVFDFEEFPEGVHVCYVVIREAS